MRYLEQSNLETGSRVAARVCRGGENKLLFKGYKVSVLQAAKRYGMHTNCECTTHSTVLLTMVKIVNFVMYILQVNIF